MNKKGKNVINTTPDIATGEMAFLQLSQSADGQLRGKVFL